MQPCNCADSLTALCVLKSPAVARVLLLLLLLRLAAPGMGQLNLSLLFAVFMTSAVLGDAVNYAIGNKLGRWTCQHYQHYQS